MTIFIFWRIQMDWRDAGIRVSYQIKTKREINRRGGGQKKEENSHPFLLYPKL
jgi:hypothetical protein